MHSGFHSRIFLTRVRQEKNASEPLVQEGTSQFPRLARNADDNDLTEPGVDRLPQVSIAWRKR